MEYRSPKESVSLVKSGDKIYVGSNCGNPVTLCSALTARASELRDVEIIHLLTFGPAPYVAPEHSESFRHSGFFVASNTREAVRSGRADYIPVFLSDVPRLFDSGVLELDFAFVSVTPPDEMGYCSLGVSVDLAKSACRNAKVVIAEVQEQMPRTCGDSCLHVSEIDFFCQSEHDLIEHEPQSPDASSLEIAKVIRGMVTDGSCIQTGFGKLPSAVLSSFRDLNDLGLHTEMFTDSIMSLVEAGNINCTRKSFMPGKAICTFAIGTRKLFDSLDGNPLYEFHPTEFVNDPFVIAKNDNMVAINSAIEIDLSGQVVADTIGGLPYSGIGGQVDFIRGSARAKGGMPIIALPSTAKRGTVSRIVAQLSPGAPVVTSRGDIHWVVTEFGAVNLHGRHLRDRARMLIEIAHPQFRDQLREQLAANPNQ